MNFIKLGKRYINLDAIATVAPRKKGLGYTANFIGGTQSAFGMWVSGIPYDLIHCVANFIICLVLLIKTIRRRKANKQEEEK